MNHPHESDMEYCVIEKSSLKGANTAKTTAGPKWTPEVHHVNGTEEEEKFPISTENVLSERYYLNQFNAVP